MWGFTTQIFMRLRKVNWIRAKNIQRRYAVDKLCKQKGFTSRDDRRGMFKLYDLLNIFCWEAKDSCGQ